MTAVLRTMRQATRTRRARSSRDIGSVELRSRAAQAVQGAFATQEFERLEQRGADRTAGDRHSHRSLRLAWLEPVLLTDRGDGALQGFGIPIDRLVERDDPVEHC